MSEYKNSSLSGHGSGCGCGNGGNVGGSTVGPKDNFCIDVNRILDSCRDRDCFTDVKVFLSECSQELVERASSVRVRRAKVRSVSIDVEPVQFNRGFYSVMLRYYIGVNAEVCICTGGSQSKSADVDGVAVVDKRVVLYGGEGSVSIFRSSVCEKDFCTCGVDGTEKPENNLPTAVCEVADPVILDVKIIEKSCPCSCRADELPDDVCGCIGGNVCTEAQESKHLAITFGLFSVIRMERPDQLIVCGCRFSVPDKECMPAQECDPCKIFASMAFPVNEFSPPALGGGCCG